MNKFVSPYAAAQILSVSRRTIYRMIATGELPSVNVRRARRIPLSAIEALTLVPELSNAETGTVRPARS